MSSWRDHPFHALLLLTEKPAGWPTPVVWLLPLGLAVGTGAAWSWAMAALQLAFALADRALLDSLRRDRLSFGPWQPPFLALSLARGLATLAAAAMAARWPVAAVGGLVLVQVVAWVVAAWGMRVEPFRVEVAHVELGARHGPGGGGCETVRVVQLSDLHVERLTGRERALPGLVRRLEPDVLVLTGDFLSTSYNRDAEALSDLAALLGELDAPLGVYAVWGTAHVDYPEMLRPVLEVAGVEVLEDRAVAVWPNGGARPGGGRAGAACAPLWLMGVTPTWDVGADAQTVRALESAAPPGSFSLLLYHLPDLMPAVATLGVDAYLAGHTHGGQWRLPGFGALVTSSRYGKRYEAGLYCEGRTRLYVSRGIGMEGFGTPRARLFCRPEVVVLDISPGPAQRQGAVADG